MKEYADVEIGQAELIKRPTDIIPPLQAARRVCLCLFVQSPLFLNIHCPVGLTNIECYSYAHSVY